MSIVLQALDAMGLALAEKGHHWTPTERWLYEAAVARLRTASCDCTGSGSSASAKSPHCSPSIGRIPASDQA